ncbi:uncharacterized protein VTP21DRAFT_10718 [Calcarisporiella thermophila]|uniref:uncharacterized protein n=1 Tax=Calcarisporiella thermophila TaxID=911321 RepID=UPI003742E0E3
MTSDIAALVSRLDRDMKILQDQNINLLTQLESLKESNRLLADENEYIRKKSASLQHELATARSDHERMEAQLFAQNQDVAELKKEALHTTKEKRELEKRLAEEVNIFEEERAAWQKREVELMASLRAANAQAGSEKLSRRASVRRSTNANSNDEPLTPAHSPGPTSISSPSEYTSENNKKSLQEARASERRVKALERRVADLMAELEKARHLTQDYSTRSQQQSARLAALEHEVAQMTQLNRSLMEDNESYQILLHEKTVSGEFMLNPILQQNRHLNQSPSVMERSAEDAHSIEYEEVHNGSEPENGGGLDLAAELDRASQTSGRPVKVGDEKDSSRTFEKMSEEIRKLKDENKAMALYVNKILLRIMENKQLVDVLSIDDPRPASTPKTDPSPPKKREGRPRSMGLWLTNKHESDLVAEEQERVEVVENPTATHQNSGSPNTMGSHPPASTNIPSQHSTENARGGSAHLRRHNTVTGASYRKSNTVATGEEGAGWGRVLRRMSVWRRSGTYTVQESEANPKTLESGVTTQ